ncbi:MAG: hypothetical protein R3E83_09440 [Burkholderiaceae bacterium]
MALRKPAPQTVFGHVIPEPKMTGYAWWWLFTRLLLPITVAGSLLDLGAQWLFGICVGLWCLAG